MITIYFTIDKKKVLNSCQQTLKSFLKISYGNNRLSLFSASHLNSIIKILYRVIKWPKTMFAQREVPIYIEKRVNKKEKHCRHFFSPCSKFEFGYIYSLTDNY